MHTRATPERPLGVAVRRGTIAILLLGTLAVLSLAARSDADENKQGADARLLLRCKQGDVPRVLAALTGLDVRVNDLADLRELHAPGAPGALPALPSAYAAMKATQGVLDALRPGGKGPLCPGCTSWPSPSADWLPRWLSWTTPRWTPSRRPSAQNPTS